MQTVGIMCGSTGSAAPMELVIRRICAQAGKDCRILRITDPAHAAACDRIVLAPEGTLASACAALSGGIGDALKQHVKAGKPCLGVSLGMLLMFKSEGLALFDGPCRALPATTKPLTGAPGKIPHVGWNRLVLEPGCHPVIAAVGRSGAWMYFCHDQYAEPADRAVVAATTEFGTSRLAAGVQRENVLGTLFRPERSHRAGIRMIVAFLELG